MSGDLTIQLQNGTAAEERMQAVLRGLLARYDLSLWTFTDTIVIDEAAWPHSHPVLTLNTANEANPIMVLGEFLHEQLHWFEEEHAETRDRAIAETVLHYPSVPTARPEGAGEEYSTRLHLLVCYLEYQAMRSLVGLEAARQMIIALSTHHYCWVYRTVLADERTLETIIRNHDFLPPPLRDTGRCSAPGSHAWRTKI